jgi:protein-S-isoprenylcysteine O-methyltransferase Ste14
MAKRTARSQSRGSRLVQILLAASAIMIGFTSSFSFAPLTRALVPAAPAVAYTGIVLTAAGIGFAIWARVFLAGNWSSSVTVKENHSLVRRGPYALVRHPIYSGILLGLIGTAIAWREVRGAISVALIFVMLCLKIRLEEKFMAEQFGDEYRDYSRQVKALIPLIY